ncbi:hypothetical protein C8R44DRAFT_734752 [Mycena epipterygia]|nr:hypothetical protein C8R44DRAFT_734752 [Mycena epipterygia]
MQQAKKLVLHAGFHELLTPLSIHICRLRYTPLPAASTPRRSMLHQFKRLFGFTEPTSEDPQPSIYPHSLGPPPPLPPRPGPGPPPPLPGNKPTVLQGTQKYYTEPHYSLGQGNNGYIQNGANNHNDPGTPEDKGEVKHRPKARATSNGKAAQGSRRSSRLAQM